MRRTAALTILATTVTGALLAPTRPSRPTGTTSQALGTPHGHAADSRRARHPVRGLPRSGTAVRRPATPANGRQGPFPGQVVPGFSGMVDAGDGTFWALPDNGFGAKSNSADFLLRLYHVTPQWQTAAGGAGQIQVGEFLRCATPTTASTSRSSTTRPRTGS